MAEVGIRRQDRRWALQNDSHADMTMAVDATLVAFGLSKPAFQIRIVEGKVRIVSRDKQPRCETAHDLDPVPVDVLLGRLNLRDAPADASGQTP